MTQKEMQDLTIFLTNENAFIGKALKNGKPSSNKRVLTESECLAFVTWFIRILCEKYKNDEFTIDVNGTPTYIMGLAKKEKV